MPDTTDLPHLECQCATGGPCPTPGRDHGMFVAHPNGYLCRCGLPENCLCPEDLPGLVAEDQGRVIRALVERQEAVLAYAADLATFPLSIHRRKVAAQLRALLGVEDTQEGVPE